MEIAPHEEEDLAKNLADRFNMSIRQFGPLSKNTRKPRPLR
jgi:hypothetical protein